MDLTLLTGQFLQHGLYLRGWSPRTVRNYRQSLAGLHPEQLTKRGINQFVLMLQQRGQSAGGIPVRLRALNSFFT